MKLKFLNIIHGWIAMFLMLLLAACRSTDEPIDSGSMEGALYLNIATIGQSRAGYESLLDNEKMKSLRVVVLHENGKVEHNNTYTLFSGEDGTKRIFIKVTPNEKKKIFLFANEESVVKVESQSQAENPQTEISLTSFFEQYSIDATGFEAAVNNLYFAPDYTLQTAIPMSSMYEFEMGEGYVEKTLYLVRVATKFTVNVWNYRDEDVTINKFSIASHADKNFLMAHVNDSEQNRQLFGEGNTWIDWLKKVSDESPKKDTALDGWLKDYELPALADKSNIYEQEDLYVEKRIIDAVHPENTKPGTTSTTFYLPESMCLKNGATDGEQEYTMSIDIAGRAEPFAVTISNLKALFRNTHVVIDIKLNNTNDILELKVMIMPWEERELELDYTETVSSAGPISWDENSYHDFDSSRGVIILKPWAESESGKYWEPLTGSFTLLTPIGAMWTASLIPTEGDPVFRFLDQMGEPSPAISGEVDGWSYNLSIVSLEQSPTHINRAKLQIIVTLGNGTVLRVPSEFDNYTIVQNPN